MEQRDDSHLREDAVHSKSFRLPDDFVDGLPPQSLTRAASAGSRHWLSKAAGAGNGSLDRSGKLGKVKAESAIHRKGNDSSSSAGKRPCKQKISDNRLPSWPLDVPKSGASKASGRRKGKDFSLQGAWERKTEGKNIKPQLDASSRERMECGSHAVSLTDDDFDELRGCIDLGFSFSHDYDADLCHTFPALKVCYAIQQSYNDSMAGSLPTTSVQRDMAASPSWQICSPGDHPQQVKAKLRHWAQAVACTVRQSS